MTVDIMVLFCITLAFAMSAFYNARKTRTEVMRLHRKISDIDNQLDNTTWVLMNELDKKRRTEEQDDQS